MQSGREEGPQAGRPSFSGSPCRPWSSGLRVGVRGAPGGCCPLCPILTRPRPSRLGPSPAGGALLWPLWLVSPVCPPVSLEPMVCHPGSTVSRGQMLPPFPERPPSLTTVGRALLLPGPTPAPCLFFWDLRVLSGHLRHRHTGCFTVRSEGGPGLILLQRPARLLSVISPKPLAFLALNSGATLSFTKL